MLRKYRCIISSRWHFCLKKSSFRNVLKYRWGWLLRIMVSKYWAACIMQELRDFYVVCQNLWIWISSYKNSPSWLFFKNILSHRQITIKFNLKSHQSEIWDPSVTPLKETIVHVNIIILINILKTKISN